MAESDDKSGDSLTSPKNNTRLRALFDYQASEEDELALKVYVEYIGVRLLEPEGDWWYGKTLDGKHSGIFPANYVEVIKDNTARKTTKTSQVGKVMSNPIAVGASVAKAVGHFNDSRDSQSTRKHMEKKYNHRRIVFLIRILTVIVGLGLIVGGIATIIRLFTDSKPSKSSNSNGGGSNCEKQREGKTSFVCIRVATIFYGSIFVQMLFPPQCLRTWLMFTTESAGMGCFMVLAGLTCISADYSDPWTAIFSISGATSSFVGLLYLLLACNNIAISGKDE